jgi:hypothetical protein
MKLYYADSLPDHVIIDDGTQLWLAAPIPGGWAERTPFRGHRAALKPYLCGDMLTLDIMGAPRQAA